MAVMGTVRVVGSAADAAVLTHAVDGYVRVVPLLQELGPYLTSLAGFQDLYWKEDALSVALLLVLGNAFLCMVAGPLTGDYSWVDRIWSIMPAAYVWHFAIRSAFDVRLVVMAVLATLWSIRLTLNFARKGGYKLGEEDYRWPELRKRMSPAAYQVFNVFFISLFQNWLLLAFVSAAHVAYLAKGTPLTVLDYVAASGFLAFLLIETISDEQQWAFQTEKHATPSEQRKGDYARGFLTQGLFRYSRHPNFFAEQALWWSFYVFSISVSGQLLNWSIAGPLVLSLLFQGSTSFTEDLSKAKYPAYETYQQTTSRLMPGPPGPSLDEMGGKKQQ